ERVALNFLQRLSGIATATRAMVDRAGKAAVFDTRKTTPGLRTLERYAVAVGGGRNHRFGLFDQVLLKENHFELSGLGMAATIERAKSRVRPGVVVGAEARDDEEADAALAAGADYVLLDNFPADKLRATVTRLRAKAKELRRALEIEASGGIDASNVAAYGATGVDRISSGALTHSARALDLALDVEPIR
ncbi:MAG TPA: carboxylating nicotinate-nucleotide diphosphorylase, partial [Planctomycetota bacterium]|nr:carboxylating nicotinate-nucleotide diphosphorylase [Planctomycetota bacterium]